MSIKLVGKDHKQRIVLNNPHTKTSCEICLHGGQIMSYKVSGDEKFYVSPLTKFTKDEKVRGGVPICKTFSFLCFIKGWPQWTTKGDLGEDGFHGFVREANEFVIKEKFEDEEEQIVGVVLALKDSPRTRCVWPHAFEMNVRIQLSTLLDFSFSVVNAGEKSFKFTTALHTYFKVNVSDLKIFGLQGLEYIDKVREFQTLKQKEKVLTISSQIDSVYNVEKRQELSFETKKDVCKIWHEGFSDVVVWNGWERCKVIPDLPEDAYKNYVCIEVARISDVVELLPGKEYKGRTTMKWIPKK